MKSVEMEVLSETVNCSVVRTPGRSFPGVVLQGDSLAALAGLADEILELSKTGDADNLLAAATMLKERLTGYQAAYERTMREHGLKLPYPERAI